MDEILFYLISVCLFFAIIKESMGIFFVKKDVSILFSVIVWSIFYAVDIIGTKYISEHIVLLLLEIASSFCLCMFLYLGSIRKKLIWVVVINLMGMITETMVGYVFIFGGIYSNQPQILGSFVSKIILLMLLMALKVLNHSRLKRDISFSHWCILFSIPVGSIFILNTLFSLCEQSNDKNATVLSLLSSAIILGLNFMIFNVYESLSDRLEIKKQQIIFNKEIELCRDQIHEREESNLNIRNLKHDIENHLICIREYLEREDFDYAIRYIDDLLKGENYFKSNSCIDSGNIVVDTLLNYKKTIMEHLQIRMLSHIEIPYELAFSDADICVILGNCLDNSIEAARKIESEDERSINVEIIYRKDSLLIMISNPFIGDVKRDNQGNFITTKVDAENHGIGLSSVKRAVQKYDGVVNISSDDNIFKIQILLYPMGKNYI